MVFWEMFMYHQNTLKILSLQYVVMFAVLGYLLTQTGNPCQNLLFNAIPSPEYNSAHYTFLGQPSQIKEDLSDDPIQVSNPVHSDSSDHHHELDTTRMIIVELQQENSSLQEQVHILHKTISNFEEQVRVTNLCNSSLSIQWQMDQDQIVDLDVQVHVGIKRRSCL